MAEQWKKIVPFEPQTELVLTGKSTGTLKILENQENFLKIHAVVDKWTWGSASIRAFEGEVELRLLNNKLSAKSLNRKTNKENHQEIATVVKDDRIQVSVPNFKIAGELVLLSPEKLSFEIKVGGALALLCRGPAIFELKKK